MLTQSRNIAVKESTLKKWTLKVEVDEEWEECTFTTRNEAVAAFVALSGDYKLNLKRAILISPQAGAEPLTLSMDFRQPQPRVN
ncbi:MAG: hypothetical protein WB992_00310 [Bryobacteraceae bacterium]